MHTFELIQLGLQPVDAEEILNVPEKHIPIQICLCDLLLAVFAFLVWLGFGFGFRCLILRRCILIILFSFFLRNTFLPLSGLHCSLNASDKVPLAQTEERQAGDPRSARVADNHLPQ
ncbi:hypothetical protein BJX70DRAFT_384172 [Aspergillus crustosus]